MTLQQAIEMWAAAVDRQFTGTSAERRRAKRVAAMWARIVGRKQRDSGQSLRLTSDTASV
jgi:hypothetical protein